MRFLINATLLTVGAAGSLWISITLILFASITTIALIFGFSFWVGATIFSMAASSFVAAATLYSIAAGTISSVAATFFSIAGALLSIGATTFALALGILLSMFTGSIALHLYNRAKPALEEEKKLGRIGAYADQRYVEDDYYYKKPSKKIDNNDWEELLDDE